MLAKRHTSEQIIAKLSRWGSDGQRREDGGRGGSSLRNHGDHVVSLEEHLWGSESRARKEVEGSRNREPQVKRSSLAI